VTPKTCVILGEGTEVVVVLSVEPNVGSRRLLPIATMEHSTMEGMYNMV
jgi:hypothetical protein